ncbi:hypothetical protein K474DRAFT_479639 [Panus rudis PR-1116 ss-1]|nr:hypothetical protein K474DRAFT_479639 [Panus rudis PR-1116 ss-1]
MMNPAVPVFFLTLVATVLLMLVTFSAPFVSEFTFLHADTAGGVGYGVWGWCIDTGNICSGKQFGYGFAPYVDPIFTKLHILYPIAAGLSLLALFSLIPVLCSRYPYRALYPFPAFSLLTLLAWLASFIGFWVSVASWVIVMKRFERDGITSSIAKSPMIWLALVATLLLMFVALNAGCGMMCRTRHGYQRRYSHYVYTY